MNNKFLQKKEHNHKQAKEEKSGVLHSFILKQRRAIQQKKKEHLAEKEQRELTQRKEKFKKLDRILQKEPFKSQFVIALRTVIITEKWGATSKQYMILEAVMDSGERHYLHNQISETLKGKFKENEFAKRCHFTAIPIEEAREALKCILPKFSSLSIADNDVKTLNSSNMPFIIEKMTGHSENPIDANPSQLVLSQGLSVANFWLGQKNKVCSLLKIDNWTYEYYCKRFKRQAEEFTRALKSKDNGQTSDAISKSTEVDAHNVVESPRSIDQIVDPNVAETLIEMNDYDSQTKKQLCQEMYSKDVKDDGVLDIPAEKDSTHEKAQVITADISNDELMQILKSLKTMQPFSSVGFRRYFCAFRLVNFELKNTSCPTIELFDDDDCYGKMLYHELIPEIADSLSYLQRPYSKYGTYLTYYVPDSIWTIEKALSLIMPELNPQSVIVEDCRYGRYSLKAEEWATSEVLEPLKLIEPDGLRGVDSELKNWFFEIKKLWNQPKVRQNTGISLLDYNRVTSAYQRYDIVRESLLQKAPKRDSENQKALQEKKLECVQAGVDDRKSYQGQERSNEEVKIQKPRVIKKNIDAEKRELLRAETEMRSRHQARMQVDQDAKIQQAGLEGEKRVEYVLNCMGPDTICIEDNTVNKYGKPCIMLKSEDWANIPQEFDHILIRENGVFLIETKNLGGTIEIDQSGNWTQTKEGPFQTKVKHVIENPSFQVYRHEKLVRSFLSEEIPVSSIICLANHRAFVKGQENSNVPVLKWDLLAQFIESQPSEKKLSREEMEMVYEQIKEHYYEYSANENRGNEQ